MTISIVVYTSLAAGQLLVGSDTAKNLSSYSHTISALGGYQSASFTIDGSQAIVEDWLADGLGRHIEVYNEGGAIVWEGFVNSISGRLGPLSVTRGPLLDVANRVRVIYSTVDTSVSPPVLGVRAVTAAAEDTDSQTAYGIIDKTLSTGGAKSGTAEQIRDTFLAENKLPQTSQAGSLQGSQQVSVTVECEGYYKWLFYPYLSTTTGDQNLSDKIEAILGADINSVFSTNYTQITANTVQVGAYEQDYDLAWDLIKGLVSIGDASDNRYNFGIYAGRQAYYAAIPTAFEYQQRIGSNSQIRTMSGAEVKPWNVLPGKWLFIPDLLPTRPASATLRQDPRAAFLESVTFTAPYDLSWQGGKTDKLSQKLAKFGLSGVGA